MQRYNMFTQVHKGLKALLYETALNIQHADFWNVDEADCVVQQVHEVISLFDKHAFSEDSFVFPAVERYEPAVADLFEKEHVMDHKLGQQLEQALIRYTVLPTLTEKAEAGCEIRNAYNRFMIFNLEHMAKEEDVLNPILWRYYSDAELHRLTNAIVAAIPPDYMAKYSRWMLRGLNNPEITVWLREVEKSAPEHVFQALFSQAEQELPAGRFRHVLEGLTEGAMLA